MNRQPPRSTLFPSTTLFQSLTEHMFIGAIGCEPLQLRRVGLENSHTLEVYRRNGGYDALRKVLGGMSPDDVIAEVKRSALRGDREHTSELQSRQYLVCRLLL